MLAGVVLVFVVRVKFDVLAPTNSLPWTCPKFVPNHNIVYNSQVLLAMVSNGGDPTKPGEFLGYMPENAVVTYAGRVGHTKSLPSRTHRKTEGKTRREPFR